MATKRLRSFFFTTSGDTQIGGFWRRFVGGGVSKPTQSTFEDLVESTPFFKEVTSAASKDTGQSLETKQGLVIIASDVNAKAGTNTADGNTGGKLVTEPSQLPIVKAEEQTIDPDGVTTFTGETLEAVVDTEVSTRNEFKIGFSAVFITWLKAALVAVRALPSGGTTGQLLSKVDNEDYNTAWTNDNTAAVDVEETNGSGDYEGAELAITGTNVTGDAGVNTTTYTVGLAAAFWTWLKAQITSKLDKATVEGGTANQVLKKSSSDNFDYTWQDLEETEVTKETTTESNGLSLDRTADSSYEIEDIEYIYSYTLFKKMCHLSFNISFDVTDGAAVSQFQIPLPDGIVKDDDYIFFGTGIFIGTGVTTICPIHIQTYGGTGQRLVIRRADDSSFVSGSSTSVVLQGSIQLVTT